MPDFITAIWNTVFFNPMLNGLVLLYGLAFHNLAITIVVFTLLIRGAMLPLTLRQLRSTKAMSMMQPKLQEIQKRYANDKQRLAQEQMRLYKEAGVNPLGCLGPQLVQIPIFIALYATIRITIGATPESMLYLSSRLYDIDYIRHAIPLDTHFLEIGRAHV